jgi:hypothetical protein
MSQRYDRTLLLDPDPDARNTTRTPLTSIKDATWEHQAVAAQLGYQSVVAMAVDEILALVRRLEERVEKLELKGAAVQTVVVPAAEVWPTRTEVGE